MNKYEVKEILINIDSKEVFKVINIFSDFDNYAYYSYNCENVENGNREKFTEAQLKYKFRSNNDLELEIHQKKVERNNLDDECCLLNLLRERIRDVIKLGNTKLNGDTKR